MLDAFLDGGFDLLGVVGGDALNEVFGEIFGQVSTGMLDAILGTLTESGILDQLDTMSFGEAPAEDPGVTAPLDEAEDLTGEE
ncbi:hypothetical protein [Lolliginicoccus suaedae]|uniref:hypothetical protein n=1 Tax=Lolliginicoccus suaedae TaxID=2605429 RepID=UPI0011EBDE61|nr:hypothetical protein [Lolliginicoccus suaedae]